MKWFKDMNEDYKALLAYFALVVLFLIGYGIYNLLDKFIDKL